LDTKLIGHHTVRWFGSYCEITNGRSHDNSKPLLGSCWKLVLPRIDSERMDQLCNINFVLEEYYDAY
jgi:hypothetical protein